MATRWTSYTLAVALAAAPAVSRAAAGPARPVEPAEPLLMGQDLAHPPPGSPADQALWRAGHEVTQAVQVERARATRLQTVLLSLRYTERLEALAARGGEAGARGKVLGRRLGDAHAQQFSVMTARWPVEPYRVCGYPAMEFGSMLAYDKADPEDLAKHRAMLTGCVEQAQASVQALRTGNDELEASMRAADAALVPAGLGPPTGAPPRAAAVPAQGDGHEEKGGKHEKRGDERRGEK